MPLLAIRCLLLASLNSPALGHGPAHCATQRLPQTFEYGLIGGHLQLKRERSIPRLRRDRCNRRPLVGRVDVGSFGLPRPTTDLIFEDSIPIKRSVNPPPAVSFCPLSASVLPRKTFLAFALLLRHFQPPQIYCHVTTC